MRLLYSLLPFSVLMFHSFFGASQEAVTTKPSTTFFVQCMVNFDSNEQTSLATNQLNSNPYVKISRLDYKTKTAFIITKDLQTVSNEMIKSWFGEYDSKITCIYYGIYAIDKMQDFPLTNCK